MNIKQLLSGVIAGAVLFGAVSFTAFADDTETTVYAAKVTSGTEETRYDTLSAAVSAASAGDTVTLLNNVTIGENDHNNILANDYKVLYIDKAIKLDLNKYTLTCGTAYGVTCAAENVIIENGTIASTPGYAVYVTAGTVNVTGCTVTASDCAFYINGGDVSLTNTSVNTSTTANNDYGVYIADNSGFALDKDSSVTGTYGVVSNGSNCTMDIYGEVTGTKYYGIATNGGKVNNTINVYEGAEIKAADNWGIYAPAANSTTNIYGGIITGGGCGIEIRGGTLNIMDGTIESTAETFAKQANGNGTSIIGAAVGVSQHTTNDDIAVNITGGKLKGLYALYEEDMQDEDSGNISIKITGGEFSSTASGESAQSVYSENVKSFISGGTFSTDVTDHITDDSAIVNKTDAGYSVLSAGGTVEAGLDYKTKPINGEYSTMRCFSKSLEEISEGVTFKISGDMEAERVFKPNVKVSGDGAAIIGLIVKGIPESKSVTITLSESGSAE